jgi:hypothetical protein
LCADRRDDDRLPESAGRTDQSRKALRLDPIVVGNQKLHVAETDM